MTLREAREFIGLLLVTNTTIAFVMGMLVFVFFVVIVGLAGQTDFESCLRGVCP